MTFSSKRLLLVFALLVSVAIGAFAQETDVQAQTNMVAVNGSFQYRAGKGISPGTIVVLYSKFLRNKAAVGATSVPLPIELGDTGTRVTVEDLPVGLFYVGDASNGQVNVFFPPRTEWAGKSVEVKLWQKNTAGALEAVDSTFVAVEKFTPGVVTANSAGSGVPTGLFLNIFLTGAQVYAGMAVYMPNGTAVPAIFDLYGNGNIKQYAVVTLTGGMFLPENGLQGLKVKIAGRANLAKLVFLGSFGFIGAQQGNIDLNGPAIINEGLAQKQLLDCTLEDEFGNVLSRFQLRFNTVPVAAADPGQ